MAALRHAARRLCERALQQRGAQARSSFVADEPRRLLLNGTSPGRRLMSNSSIGGKGRGKGELELLEWQFKKKKEELFDLLIAVKCSDLYPQLSWKDIETHRLITHLASQVEPRPHDPIWYNLKHIRLNEFNTICAFLVLYGQLLAYWVPTNIREYGAASKNSEANSVSEPKNDMN
ncbi:hypothetical protein ZWY2020_045546 [Hordeum vulgare]|nr:hypothetical protein ZWY2020_045546 [Hordeum vulgare]